MKKVTTASAIVTIISIPNLAQAADCRIDNYSFVFGTDTSTHMTVKSGRTCGRTMHINGGVTGLMIAQSPQSGKAMTSGNNHWEYRAAPGYTGRDAFVVQISGEAMGNARGTVHSGSTNISVDVDVVP